MIPESVGYSPLKGDDTAVTEDEPKPARTGEATSDVDPASTIHA